MKLIGKAKVIVDRGVKPEDKPIWTEGPHIFKRKGYYFLTAAEGGTADDHAQTIYRSKAVTGPYLPASVNPILTQRDLPPARSQPVYATGHADFIQLASGDWWAVFLGTRPYEGNLTNLGRETFLLPVEWKNDWPIILPHSTPLPLQIPRPATKARSTPPGILSWKDNFAGTSLGREWLMRRPWLPAWAKFSPQNHGLHLGDDGTPSFVGRRLQHHQATIETEVNFLSNMQGSRAGLLAIADENQMLFFGVERTDKGSRLIAVSRAGQNARPYETLLHFTDVEFDTQKRIQLRATFDGPKAHFAYRSGNATWTTFLEDVDARILATQYNGLLFTGTIFGPYAGVGLP
jgi:alpha-N-arabinofuranosidase